LLTRFAAHQRGQNEGIVVSGTDFADGG